MNGCQLSLLVRCLIIPVWVSSQEQQGGMLSSMFSAYSFVPLRTLNSPGDYAEWMGRLEKDTSLTDTPAHRKQLALLKHWFSDTKQAQVEYVHLSLSPLALNVAR